LVDIHPHILAVAAGTLLVMIAGSIARLLALRGSAPDVSANRRRSLLTWWVVVLLILGAASLGRYPAIGLFLLMSVVGLREFFRLRRNTVGSRVLTTTAYGLALLSYLWIGFDKIAAFWMFLPLAGLLLLSIGHNVSELPQGFIDAIAETYWALLLTSYAPAFALLLFTLPAEMTPAAGGAAWFLFLLLLTETNDICQALVGRRLGKRKIAPDISPHKTWAGLFGGMIVTTLLAGLLGPWLTPWRPAIALAAGPVICVAGFFGDLNVSAFKRDCGVKDSSDLLPGQGGMLDRMNSLTFTAPTFYAFVLLIDYARNMMME